VRWYRKREIKPVVYLDTGCLVKLYYPERESVTVAAAVVGEQIAFTALHELEIVTAMQLKVFCGEATPAQVVAATHLVQRTSGQASSWSCRRTGDPPLARLLVLRKRTPRSLVVVR
jgi:hypothetical protein